MNASVGPTPGVPRPAVEVGRVEAVPRRIRAQLAGRTVVDTRDALYVWEWPWYPAYRFPRADVAPELVAAGGDDEPELPELAGTVRIAWDAVDAWFEEDEQVFVHPRSPYVRVDALRSRRTVRVELDGVVLAESSSPVLLFETGLPTRYYLDRTAVDLTRLVPSQTRTDCPYKGRTSGYWSVRTDADLHADLAWSYEQPAAAVVAVAGLIAFYDERVDVVVDGVPQARPRTHLA